MNNFLKRLLNKYILLKLSFLHTQESPSGAVIEFLAYAGMTQLDVFQQTHNNLNILTIKRNLKIHFICKIDKVKFEL